MKYIQSILAIFALILGMTACSADETSDPSADNVFTDGTLRLLPVAPPAYGANTRVTTDGTDWTEGDVVFIRVTFYADEAMTQIKSFVYTALCYHEDEGWTTATSQAQDNATPDFTFKVVDAGGNNALWGDNSTIVWPLQEAKAAKVQAVYAGLYPIVEVLNRGEARIAVNNSSVGIAEMLTASLNLRQTDLTDQPINLSFSHRLLRLDLGKEPEQEIWLSSGGNGSGVSIVPESIDFSGAVKATNTLSIPRDCRYFYLAPDEMLRDGAARKFRLGSGNVVLAIFTLPEKPAGNTTPGAGYYYGRSYSLSLHNGGSITPDDMTGI